MAASLATASVSAIADVLALKKDHPQEYVVVKGDTLWDISGRFLQSPWRWPEIWGYNSQIEDPHWIYPGDIIRLVYIDGKPRLIKGSGGVVKLSPNVRSRDIIEAIPPVSLEAIGPFLDEHRIVDPNSFEISPHVIMGAEKHLLVGAGDRFYARGDFETDGRYGVYRMGKIYNDAEGNVIGVEALDIGTADMLSRKTDIAEYELLESRREIRPTDRLMPAIDLERQANFYPKAPVQNIEGKIVHAPTGVRTLGALSVVVIDQGAQQALEPGDVLAIYQVGEVVTDRVKGDKVKLPDERSGLLMVFSVTDQLSYGLILATNRALEVGDIVRSPDA